MHGGAGTILKSSMTPEKETEYKTALEQAIKEGNNILTAGGTALDAVTASVVSLENCELFNAGKGSVFTAEGKHEMDASIMCGKTLEAGAVAGISKVKNPIAVAKDILEKSEHVMLLGDGALEYAQNTDFEVVSDAYFFNQFRYDQWQEVKDTDTVQLDHSDKKETKFGTVGAAACDAHGNIAAATSTGGMTNKRFGRVGDSPLIGAGNYANNETCAISCTGHGEFFIRGVVAYDISCLIEYKGMSLQGACDEVIQKRMMKLGGDGGVIGVDIQGNIGISFNSPGMYRAYVSANDAIVSAIYK